MVISLVYTCQNTTSRTTRKFKSIFVGTIPPISNDFNQIPITVSSGKIIYRQIDDIENEILTRMNCVVTNFSLKLIELCTYNVHVNAF